VTVFERALDVGLAVGIVAAGAINGAAVIPHEFVGGIGLMRHAIQSGLLISAECLRRSGLFDERLVIDAVDTEFCLRARHQGFEVAAAAGTDIVHELGQLMPLNIFGYRLTRAGVSRQYEYHPPFRQYYISRNGIDIVTRYLRSETRWSVATLRSDFINFWVGFAAGPHRGRHAMAGLVGLTHGVLRHRGKLSPWWTRRLSLPR
jgi:rhamnosyltransferase